MRIAAVRLKDGRTVWADAGTWLLTPLDEVTVRLSHADALGTVFVTPEQLLQLPQRPDGVVIEIYQCEVDEINCLELPGAEMPPLGSTVPVQGTAGTIVRVDAVHRRVRLRQADGSEVVLPLADLS